MHVEVHMCACDCGDEKITPGVILKNAGLPARLGLNEHVIKLDSLNVADMGLSGRPLIMALGLLSSACAGFLGS